MGKTVTCKKCGNKVKIRLSLLRRVRKTQCENCKYIVDIEARYLSIFSGIYRFVIIMAIMLFAEIFRSEPMWLRFVLGASIGVIMEILHLFLFCFIWDKAKIEMLHYEEEIMDVWELNEPDDGNLPWGRRR